MKVLLINSNRYKHPWPVIPFGLCAVASSVEHAGHQVRVLDLCFAEDCAGEISAAIAAFQPALIGISVRNIDNSVGYNTLFLLEEVRREVIAPCKAHFPGPIVIGGPAVGVSAVEALDFFDLAYAIRGDGETALVEMLARLEKKEPLDGLGGLTVRRDGKIVQDTPPSNHADINSFQFPSPYKYVDLKPYVEVGSHLQVQSKRGCPLNCVYCTYNVIEGKKFRLRDPEAVVDEIEQLVAATGVNRIEFTDSVFNIPLYHCKQVLRSLIDRKLNLRLRSMGLNPATVDDELVDLMKEAGFGDVDLGAESGSDVTLKSLGKSFSKRHVLAAGKRFRKKRIPVTWFLLLGSPAETRETLAETFATITQAASRWDLIIIAIGMRVYKGAPISEQFLRENPAGTHDNFLSPVHVRPERIDIETIKLLTKAESFNHPNFLMYDEDGFPSMRILRIGYLLMKWFAPHQPQWKMYIFIRTFYMLAGINFVKRCLFAARNRTRFREFDRPRMEALPQ